MSFNQLSVFILIVSKEDVILNIRMILHKLCLLHPCYSTSIVTIGDKHVYMMCND